MNKNFVFIYLKYLIELYKLKAIPATNSASKLEFDRVNEEILDIKVQILNDLELF